MTCLCLYDLKHIESLVVIDEKQKYNTVLAAMGIECCRRRCIQCCTQAGASR